jgi:hypothetical protein
VSSGILGRRGSGLVSGGDTLFAVVVDCGGGVRLGDHDWMDLA